MRIFIVSDGYFNGIVLQVSAQIFGAAPYLIKQSPGPMFPGPALQPKSSRATPRAPPPRRHTPDAARFRSFMFGRVTDGEMLYASAVATVVW
jgi:hypothetical protein